MLGATVAAAPDAEKLYNENCSVCHGDKGDGKSRAAGSLNPPPKDFASPQSSAELSRERMIVSVTEGRPGTAMGPWRDRFSAEEIAAVVDFIRERFMLPVAYEGHGEGRRVYAEYCSVCHGDKGDGRSRASSSMLPPPRNFTSAEARRDLPRDRMIFSVLYGRANTAMASWETQLSREQVEAVVDYIRVNMMGLRPGEGQQVAAQHDHSDASGEHHVHATPLGDLAAFHAEPFAEGLNGDRNRGEALYRFNCVPCHGDKGDGRGPRAYFILPKPRDFGLPAARAALNRPHLFESIAKGTLGSEMPAWDKVFGKQEIADVSEYVLQAFIQPQPMEAAGKMDGTTHMHTDDAAHKH